MSRVLPILFNTDMVQAILDGRKTVTRRKIDIDIANWFDVEHDGKTVVAMCGYQPGDILYVRETWNNCGKGYRYKADLEKDGIADITKWHPSIHMPKEAARIWLKVTDVRAERLQNITEEQAIREGIIRLYDDLPDTEYIAWAKRTGVFPKEKGEWGYKNYLWHGNFGSCGTGNKMSDAWKYQYSSYDNARDSFSSLWNTTVPLKDWYIYGWDANPWVWAIQFEWCENPEEVM